MSILIGLTGQAGSGKSTAADYLRTQLGFERLRFAGPLKAMMRAFLLSAGVDSGVADRMIDGDLKEVPHEALRGKTPRYAMQTIGAEWGRELIGFDIWTNTGISAARAHMAQGLSVVIDDVRFQNEVDIIRATGGIIVRIERPGLAPIATSSHISEQPIQGDCRVYNDGPTWILGERMAGIVERLQKKVA